MVILTRGIFGEEVEILQRRRKVLVAMPCMGHNNCSITRLFWELGVLNTERNHPFTYDTFIAEDFTPHDRARNMIVRAALGTDMDFLWQIDADMRIPPNWQLLFSHYNRKAVSGLAFGWQSSGMGARHSKPMPVVFRRTKDWSPTEPNGLSYEGDDLQSEPFEADAVGAACLLLRRDLIEKVGFPWFKFAYEEDGEIKEGEDVHFFRKANALGERVLIDTRVLVGHWKETDTMDIALYGRRVRLGALKEAEQCRSAAG